MNSSGSVDLEELIKEREECLPSVISSFSEDNQSKCHLDSIKVAVKYLITYNIEEVDSVILQHIMPIIKSSLQKIYKDNFLISDTIDYEDVFLLNMLKENIQIATEFMTVLKRIFEFILPNNDLDLSYVTSVPLNVSHCLILTFDHYKNCTENYRGILSTDLKELFQIAQELHLLLFQLFISCILIREDDICSRNILNEVLDAICNIGNLVTNFSIKSVTDNWKGFVRITQKFVNILSGSINLELPINSLSTEIYKNLKFLFDLIPCNAKLIDQLIKLSSFFIKVLLEICETFPDAVESVWISLVNFYCVIYSFPLDCYRSANYTEDILKSIEKNIICTDILLLKLVGDYIKFKEDGDNIYYIFERYPHGALYFLNRVLELYCANCKASSDDIIFITKTIFNLIPSAYPVLYWKSDSRGGIFEDIIINIASGIVIYETYENVEKIFLENLLQKNVFKSLLALEIWTLILSKSSHETCCEALLNLINSVEKLDFGVFTTTPEEVYLKYFMQRIFKMLPNSLRSEIALKYSISDHVLIWKLLGLSGYPFKQVYLIAMLMESTVERIGAMVHPKDLIFAAEKLEILATVKLKDLGLNYRHYLNEIYNFWEMDLLNRNIIDNNVFKYFMFKLGKATKMVLEDFDGRQIFTILNQLSILSTSDTYKLLVCDILCTIADLSYMFDTHVKQEISVKLSDTIYQYLLKTSSHVIKQNVLDLVKRFSYNPQFDTVVKTVTDGLTENEFLKYVRGDIDQNKIDYEYFKLLGSWSFEHKCIEWSAKDITHEEPDAKKFKKDEIYLHVNQKEVRKKPKLEEKVPIVSKNEFPSCEMEDCVSECIVRLKGEVKCLSNILKTEKLSRKNVTDLKMITNQLLSFM